MISYHLLVSTTAGASDDFSKDVIRAVWRLGCPHADTPAAPPGAATFPLDNRSRRYSPARAWASPALRPSAVVVFEARTTSGAIRLFTGQIAAITSDGDPFQPMTVVHARTIDAQFEHTPARPPALINVDAGAALTALLDTADLRRPDQTRYWLLDQPGHAELDSAARLAPDFSASASIQAGISRFAYLGLGGGSLTVAEAVRRIAAGEDGLVYVDRFDQLRFLNRHERLRGAAPVAIADDSILALDYAFADDVIGRVLVRMTPRRVGAAGSPLWTLDAPLRIDPGTRTLTVTFRQADRPLAALAISGTAFTATTAPAGGIAAPVYAIVLRADSASAVIEISNPGQVPVYLTPGSAVLGTPLIEDDPIVIERSDPLALHTFGGQTLTLTRPLIDDVETAEQCARFALYERAFPRGRCATIALVGDSAALGITIGARVTVGVPAVQDGLTAFVVGESHELDRRADPPHRIRLTLIPNTEAGRFWQLDSAPLGMTSTLAY